MTYPKIYYTAQAIIVFAAVAHFMIPEYGLMTSTVAFGIAIYALMQVQSKEDLKVCVVQANGTKICREVEDRRVSK